jgi:DNA polymerase elongation subunit (family B)
MADTHVFHCLDILPRDEIILNENEEETQVAYDSNEDADDEFVYQRRQVTTSGVRSQLIIHMFGRLADGRAVSLDVEGYRPYFYVAAPETLAPNMLRLAQRQLAEFIERKGFYNKSVTITLEYREKFYGFTNHTAYPFYRLTVNSKKEFDRLKRVFLDGDCRPTISGHIGSCWPRAAPPIYEANIDPMLRFLHERNLEPCGWIRSAIALAEGEAIRVNYADLSPAVGPITVAPFKLVSWDIECFSASGDFPQAKRDYKKVAKEICRHATTGREAVELVAASMPFAGVDLAAAPLSPINPKSRLTGDARAHFDRVMCRDAVYRDIERHLGVFAEATNAEGRDEAIGGLTATLNALLGGRFPLAGDPCIQIGNVVAVNGAVQERHLFVFPSCDPIEGVTVHVARDEITMLRTWFEWMELMNPDILIGYNVWRFDESYVWGRAEELGIADNLSFQALNRLEGGDMKLNELFLSSSALGDNKMYMFNTQGRLEVDMFYYIKPRQSLTSYKLDSVAQFYMSGALVKVEPLNSEETKATLKVKGSSAYATPGRAIQLLDEDSDPITEKLTVLENLGGGNIVVSVGSRDAELWAEDITLNAAKWVIVKDDVTAQELFKLHTGSPTDRAIIGRYCIQDCDLVHDLYKKLEVFMNSMAMANISSVPVRYIFSRGQGIKIESLIFKECTALNKCILTLPAPNRNGGGETYEGAIVLTPVPGLYHRSPIGVADFASLYPSSIVSENISHDTLVWSKDYKADGTFVRMSYGSEEFEQALEETTDLDVEWTDIRFDLWIPDPEDTRKNPEKIKNGFRVCRYAQDQPGTLPIIIKKLLAARNAKKKEMGKEEDASRKVLLDAEQLSYKLTANSLYGQLGSGTFKVRLQDLAASTTAYGRKQIMFAKEVIEHFYGPGRDPRCGANIMYGDTDSLFIEFNPRDPATGQPLQGREAREATIGLTEEAGKLVSQVLKSPHDFEFDKVYHPFMIFAKKRYVGKLYDANPDDCYLMTMGMSIKRRDYAPILKVIFKKAIDAVMDRNDVGEAMAHVQDGARDLVENRVKMALLILSNSLKSDYADPTKIAHRVLADRMTARDPGTAPSVGDRVDYVFVKAPNAKLKGDRIENPAYILANNIPIDSGYYIEKQLQNPLSQFFGLLLERMPDFHQGLLPSTYDEMNMDQQSAAREKVAGQLLFGPAWRTIEHEDKKTALAKMFGGKAVLTKTSTAQTRAAAAQPLPQKAPKQSRMSNYFTNKKILETVGSSRRKTRSRESSVSTGSAKSK